MFDLASHYVDQIERGYIDTVPDISANTIGLLLAEYFDMHDMRGRIYRGELSIDLLEGIQQRLDDIDLVLDAANLDQR